MAIGPLTFSFALSKSETSENRDLLTSAVSRANSRSAKPAASAGSRATRLETSAFASSCAPMRPSPEGETLGVTTMLSDSTLLT